MVIVMDNPNEYIRKSAKKLNLNRKAANRALSIYKKAISHPRIDKTRIRDENIAVASLYIAARLTNSENANQNIFVYKLNISFATLRKCYIRVCDVLKIPREDIVPSRHLVHKTLLNRQR